MGKNQVPGGKKLKVKCNCGLYYYPIIYGSAMKLTTSCPVCDPEKYKGEDKK